MRITGLVIAAAFVAVTASSVVSAQTTTPAPAPATPPPATSAPAGTPAKPTMSDDQKAKISAECSAEADKQGLHGKARSKFRSQCKRQKQKG